MGKKKTVEYDEAYGLYCDTEITQKEIARIVNISEAQISKWVTDNDWELDKTAKKVTAQKLIRQYYGQLAQLNEAASKDKRILNSTETDAVSKIMKAIEALDKKNNLTTYHAVLKETLEYFMQADAEKAKLFGPTMLDFLKYKASLLQK